MTKLRWLTVTNPTCDVVVFMRPDGSAQAVIKARDHTTTHEIPVPSKGQRMIVKRTPDGCVEVIYEETPEEQPNEYPEQRGS